MLLRKQGNNNLIAVPSHMLDILVEQHHYCIFTGHLSPTAMYRALSKHYHHRRMKQAIKKVCDACVLCATFRTRPEATHHLGTQYDKEAKNPRASFQIDILPYTAPDGKDTETKYLLIAVELRSLFIQLIPMRSRSETHIYNAILEIIRIFGTPTRIRSDSETALTNNFVADKLKLLE